MICLCEQKETAKPSDTRRYKGGANKLKVPCSDLKTVCITCIYSYALGQTDCMDFFFPLHLIYMSYSFVPGRGHSAS